MNTTETYTKTGKFMMKTRIAGLCLALASFWNCAGLVDSPALKKVLGQTETSDVDMNMVTILAAGAIPPGKALDGGGSGGPGSGPVDLQPSPSNPDPVTDIFSQPLGSMVPIAALGDTVAPIGTTLTQDFDGDGILNQHEVTSNIWVGDYPVIEAVIATPVLMKIHLLKHSTSETTEITSEINSSDNKSSNSLGSENVHRREGGLRTEHFMDKYSNSDAQSGSQSESREWSVNGGMSAPMGSISGGGGASNSSGSSFSNAYKTEQTVNKWEDHPFKDNSNRDVWSIDSNAAAAKARKFRSDKRTKVNESFTTTPRAGYVRAPFFLKNRSINIPVKISNIRASFVFETSAGVIIPIKSFLLRNEDFTPFEVEVYGNTEFGPYVIELTDLNTAEVEDAIRKGYNPRIYIVSYDMHHVADSNYKSPYLSYSGDNLKVIEENVKGRSARIRLIGPGLRQVVRIPAFRTDADPDTDLDTNSVSLGGEYCSGANIKEVGPGVSLKVALERLGCSGITVEYGNYLMDLSDLTESVEPVLVRGVKRIGPIENKVPCVDNELKPFTDSNGKVFMVCVMKKLTDFTTVEQDEFGMWNIFAKGRYFTHSEFRRQDAQDRFSPELTLNGGGYTNVRFVKGVNSIIWAGDQYDVTYIKASDLIQEKQEYGNNPLQTGDVLRVNTRWQSGKGATGVGSEPFSPTARSFYLGQAGLGDEIQFRINLLDTTVLNYDFGRDLNGNASGGLYGEFTRSLDTILPADKTYLFGIEETLDFEISLGVDGKRSGWFHILRDVNASIPDPNQPGYDDAVRRPTECGRSVEYLNQAFTFCLQLPEVHDDVTLDSVVDVYFRPTLNNAFRNTIWPETATKVNKFSGKLDGEFSVGALSLNVTGVVGVLAPGDSLKVAGDDTLYEISSLTLDPDDSTKGQISLAEPLQAGALSGAVVSVNAGLSSAQVQVNIDQDFFTTWNAAVASPLDLYRFWEQQQKTWLLTENSSNWYCPGDANLSLEVNTRSEMGPNSTQCLGFTFDYLVANWTGNSNMGNPYFNSFNDAALYADFMDFFSAPYDPAQYLKAGSGSSAKYLGLELNGLPEYGTNHFFMAPLIERNFDVTAQIIR